jgi:dienelactone hydrolase
MTGRKSVAVDRMNWITLLLFCCIVVGISTTSNAAVVEQPVSYSLAGTNFAGYLAYDEALRGKRPGVVVFPEWWGLNDYPKERARQLAAMGYVALAADMYGNGKVATNATEAGKLAGQFRSTWDTGGREMMRQRAQVALATLAANPRVDPTRLAAIGYCFGGTVAQELAYSGANLRGAVIFHGGLNPPAEGDLTRMKAKLLILHGSLDTNTKPEDIAAMQQALDKGRVDWEMVIYGGAKHGFTNPANTGGPGSGVAYNEPAARRSWQAMIDFFREVLR